VPHEFLWPKDLCKDQLFEFTSYSPIKLTLAHGLSLFLSQQEHDKNLSVGRHVYMYIIT
jgi:hypothetical protein